MKELFISVAVFISILALLNIIRLKVGSRLEIRNTDILIAIIPVALWLVLTGKIQRLEFGDFKIEAAFIQASTTSVERQITPIKLPVEPIVMSLKGGVERIPELVADRTEALVFRLGYSGYYWRAIMEYLGELTKYPFFKYVVITEKDGRFFGLADGRALYSLFRFRRAGPDPRDFERWLKTSDRDSLSGLPGFISKDHTISRDTDKKTALELMERLGVDTLPVVDGGGRLVGVVERARLTASLIIDVAEELKQ